MSRTKRQARDKQPFQFNSKQQVKQHQHPPVQQQLDMLFRGINSLVDHLSEFDLRLEFCMRQIRLGRVKPGGIIDPATGKLPIEQLTLLELFTQQREMFAAQLMAERDAIIRAQQDENRREHGTGQAINGHGAEQRTADEGEHEPAERTSPAGLILLPGAKES